MSEISRRSVLTLGAALGLTGVVAPHAAHAAWSSSPSRSVLGTGAGTDPQWVWDDDIDRIMADVTVTGQVPAVNAAILPWVDNGHPLPTGLPPELEAWLGQAVALPSWADAAKMRQAADFGYDLGDRNAFEPGGQIIVTANKTRMVHATVRHLLPQSPYWKAVADEEIPISNADILVTFHSTGTFAHKKLKEWGVRMSAADEEAFLHSWQLALHFLGVRDEYIPATWADAHAQADPVLTPKLAWTPEGQELAEVLLGLTAQVDLGVTRGFLNEFVRYQLGDEVGDWLGLKRDPASKVFIKTGWPTYIKVRDGLIPVAPASFWVFDKFIKALAMAFLNKGSSGSTTPITIPDMNRPGVEPRPGPRFADGDRATSGRSVTVGNKAAHGSLRT